MNFKLFKNLRTKIKNIIILTYDNKYVIILVQYRRSNMYKIIKGGTKHAR